MTARVGIPNLAIEPLNLSLLPGPMDTLPVNLTPMDPTAPARRVSRLSDIQGIIHSEVSTV